ncbi:linear amide C-N hydrolase [Paraferrimonas sedimenticola]|uniref:Choloylglycine hydrolase/NAAA C-terminal domain-containing protein n=1 Tax=Paraferrimonas sedimenticola TaxID=375674 RepID=A0AA37RVY1_9GAMM|nr:linear amide C-N hydrolase [Paraferrimonas sedimenticola]GLP96304.1 hypothetical protein GCM10007895_16100 [Paraferrimonas sedimenticola]
MKKTLLALTVAATTFGAIQTADACSRLIFDGGEQYGSVVVRTFEWNDDQPLQSIAKAIPVGTVIEGKDVPEYKKRATWTAKHHVVDYVEFNTFHNTSGEAINDKGLSSSMLYQAPSAEFIKDADDTGAPTVHLSDIVNYMVTQFATVDEAVESFEKGEFQVAWKTGIGGHQHGFHFSVQDKSGAVALFQLYEGGEMVVHKGDIHMDLAVMANKPLRRDVLEHMAQFDMDDTTKMPADISSHSRYVRGNHAVRHTKIDPTLDWIDVRGKAKSAFDWGNKIPQDIGDPTNDGETYATWETYVYNLNDLDTTYYNEGNGTQLEIDFGETKAFSKTMCANIFEQAKTQQNVTWAPCK